MDKLLHSRVVLLRALPRAGRTSLLGALVHEMDNGSAMVTGEDFSHSEPQEIQASFGERTVFVDAIQADQVEKIDAVVRSCLEYKQSSPRFVFVGRGAKTEQKLSGALTGIITDVELPPVQILEHLNDSKPLVTTQSPTREAKPQARPTNLPVWQKEVLWLRGGLPDSLLANSDDHSFAWRTTYLGDLLKQDFSCWDIDASDRLPDVFQFVANNNGNQFDYANCARTLSVKKESIRKSLDLLERMGVLRRLPNWPAGSNQSLNSMPVYYVRDCGLLHAMLGIDSIDKLLDSNAAGHSWESFAIETIINAASGHVTPAFYRDKNQNEIDLVLNYSSGATCAIEIKRNETARAKSGFAVGCDAIGATHRMVVHGGESDIRPDDGIQRLSLISAIRSLQ
ncbi:ATP-binding protein [Aliiroseovarius sp. CAU 1755]